MLAQLQVANESLPLPNADATGDELFRLGLLYSTGQGGAPLDYVSAHMLFNLAAMRGSVEAKIYRKELSEEMASEFGRRGAAPGSRVARPGLRLSEGLDRRLTREIPRGGIAGQRRCRQTDARAVTACATTDVWPRLSTDFRLGRTRRLG